MTAHDTAIAWLLDSNDPSVRHLTLTQVLGREETDPEVAETSQRIPKSARVRALLDNQRADGGFGVHPYRKWGGAHWRLVSLIELGAPPSEPLRRAADQVLGWLTHPAHRSRVPVVRGLPRRCASQEGNALAVCSRLGMADDPRVHLLATSLMEWQWPDGGWNCDRRPEASHASFHESLSPMWGLQEYHRLTGDAEALAAARRTAELFLRHRLFRSDRTGDVIHPAFLRLRYPPYWHFDILQALRRLAPLGLLGDPRAQEALDVVEAKPNAQGRWRAEGSWWNPPGRSGPTVEVVDWGRRGPNEMITLQALIVLKAAGRLGSSGR